MDWKNLMSAGRPYPYQPTILLAPTAAYSGTCWQNLNRNCAGYKKKCGRRAQSHWRHTISPGLALLQSDRTHRDEMGGRALETNECTTSPSMTASAQSTNLELSQPRLISFHSEFFCSSKSRIQNLPMIRILRFLLTPTLPRINFLAINCKANIWPSITFCFRMFETPSTKYACVYSAHVI